MNRKGIALVALLMLGCASNSWALGRGSSMFALEFTGGTADLADFVGSGTSSYIGSYSIPEVGIQGQYWYMAAEDYAIAVSLGVGMSKDVAKPGNAAPPTAVETTAKVSSMGFRIGGDRVIKIGERTVMYGGPGIEYWQGKAKYENVGFSLSGDYEGENTKRYSLSARIGATLMLNPMTGITAHFGQRIGYASAEQDGAKTTWWPSSFEGAMGVSFSFGGAQ